MYYTDNPHRDAESYENHLDDLQSRSEAKSFEYRNEIDEGFKTFTELPYVAYVSGKNKIKQQAFSEAVSDQIQDDKIFSELIKVLKTSECPKVKALLVSMADHYAAYWLGDLVDAA